MTISLQKTTRLQRTSVGREEIWSVAKLFVIIEFDCMSYIQLKISLLPVIQIVSKVFSVMIRIQIKNIPELGQIKIFIEQFTF